MARSAVTRFTVSLTRKKTWWAGTGLNRRHQDFQGGKWFRSDEPQARVTPCGGEGTRRSQRSRHRAESGTRLHWLDDDVLLNLIARAHARPGPGERRRADGGRLTYVHT